MTLEVLTKRIKTTTDLRDIVSTMKMLSSVSIGPYEKALLSLQEYGKTVRSAFQGLLHDDEFFLTSTRKKNAVQNTIAIVIGTDNGLVGRFNRDVLQFAKNDLKNKNILDKTHFLCVGKRLGLLLESAKLPTIATYPIMNSLKEIASIAAEVLLKINSEIPRLKAEQVFVYYMNKKQGETQKPTMMQLMPLPQDKLDDLKKEKWEGRTLPLITADRLELFSALIHEYLTVVLGGALTSSLAAEHYTRMLNMQQAEKNIDESLDEMNLDYQQLRQTGITDELIDIVSGAESMKKKK